jgi:hypothetical protein
LGIEQLPSITSASLFASGSVSMFLWLPNQLSKLTALHNPAIAQNAA